MTTLCRSYLWTTALMPDKYHYAQKVSADVCVIDLEDSVPIEQKDQARKLAINFLEQKHDYKYALRINSIRTQFGIRDINALLNSKVRPYMIVIPKVESPEEIIMVNQWLSNIPDLCFCAIIETARGMQNIYDIALTGNNLKYLLWGSADLSSEIGVTPDWPGADQIRSLVMLAATRGGISALDTADFDLADDMNLEDSCRHVKSFGFTGKACVHPRQIPIVNKVFKPSADETYKAKQIIKACKKRDGAIAVVHGEMIGPPMFKMARRVLGYQ